MSLNESIDDHKTGDYTVTRRTGGAWSDDGRYTGGASSTLLISASVQPAGEQIDELPEGTVLADVRMVYTETRLYARKRGVAAAPGAETAAFDPDEISIDGEAFRVWSIARWDHWGESHSVATVVRVLP